MFVNVIIFYVNHCWFDGRIKSDRNLVLILSPAIVIAIAENLLINELPLLDIAYCDPAICFYVK